jgi:hypothetical protein
MVTVPPAEARLTVGVVGDSISYTARTPLESELADKGFDRIEFDAKPGRRIAQGDSPGIAVLDDAFDRGLFPDLWLIQLGSNDLGHGATDDAFRVLIDDVLRRLDAATPVVWVDTYSRFTMEDSVLFNTVLREQLTVRGNGAVAHWYDRCVADPDLTPDGLHPSPDTIDEFASVAVEPIGIQT